MLIIAFPLASSNVAMSNALVAPASHGGSLAASGADAAAMNAVHPPANHTQPSHAAGIPSQEMVKTESAAMETDAPMSEELAESVSSVPCSSH
jgi:hypothetical protein